MTPTKVKDFLTSLSPDKEQAEEMKGLHGWLFDMHISFAAQHLHDCIESGHTKEFAEYLLYRCRRAESLKIPDLKDKVSDFGRYCLHVATEAAEHPNNEDKQRLYEQLSHICAPEEVKP